MKQRTLGVALAVGALSLTASARGNAQAAPRADAGAVTLRLRPRVGDTLHTRLEQQTEVSFDGRGDAPSTAKAGSARSVVTSVLVDSRTIVLTQLPASVLVMTVVDSASLHTSDAHGAAQIRQAEGSLRGQQIVLQLAADGTVESARDVRGGNVSRDMASAMSSMPAVFPKQAVRVGDRWTRVLPLPSGGPLGARGSGHVDAVFRLDSLDRLGMAFLSVTGDIRPDSSSAGVEISGIVSGAMQVDRARGWMTDSRFNVTLRSLITPPANTGLQPMRFVTRVTQRLRTMDKR